MGYLDLLNGVVFVEGFGIVLERDSSINTRFLLTQFT